MSLTLATLAFLGLAAIIATAGTRLTRTADKIADLTGIGEALVGGILLGAISSLSGITTSVTAAYDGHAQLAFSNAIGGIAAQTVFLAVADLNYRKANLEHASASLPNLMQGILLILMLTFVLATLSAPSFTFGHVHPSSILLLAIYISGSIVITRARQKPMWKPRNTKETVIDVPDEDKHEEDSAFWVMLRLLFFAAIVGVAGYYVAKVAVIIAQKSGLSESFVGALFTSVATSLPELVISISAVRQRALTLAIANIIGGNSFDVLFLAFADIAYVQGSIYHEVGQSQSFLLSLSILLAGVLLMGLLHRQKRGLAGVGWESITMLTLFVVGYVMLYFM